MVKKDLKLLIFKALGLALSVAALVLTIIDKLEVRAVLILICLSMISYGFYLLEADKLD